MAKGNGKAARSSATAETRRLPVKLSQAELLIRADEMADCEVGIEVLKAKRGTLNDQIKKFTKRRLELGHVIEKGEEAQEVRCEWVPDFQKNVFRLTRPDGEREVIDTRPMSGDDRQLDLMGDVPVPPRSPRTDKPKAARGAPSAPSATGAVTPIGAATGGRARVRKPRAAPSASPASPPDITA